MTAIAGGGLPSALAAVPGLTPTISAAGALAYRHAYMDAYRTVFLVSIAFGGLGIIVSFFVPNVDKNMTNSIATTLHGTGADTNMRELERGGLDANETHHEHGTTTKYN